MPRTAIITYLLRKTTYLPLKNNKQNSKAKSIILSKINSLPSTTIIKSLKYVLLSSSPKNITESKIPIPSPINKKTTAIQNTISSQNLASETNIFQPPTKKFAEKTASIEFLKKTKQ